MAEVLSRLIRAQSGWARPLGNAVQSATKAVFGRLGPVRDLLNGTWLGHPLHPAVTDLPIGAFIVVLILDVLNERTAADAALIVGLLGMVGAALTGLADYNDTDSRPRLVATVHSTVMVIGLVVYLVSLALRLQEPIDRTAPIIVGVIGLLIVLAGAYVGGDVVFAIGNMVDRHAWRSRSDKWMPLDLPSTTVIPEATPTKVKAGAQTLVIVRLGDAMYALHEQCAHAGGPLSEGTIVDACIQCPWHGSRFGLANGAQARGPAVYNQPSYEVRLGANGYEARFKVQSKGL